MTDGQIRFVGLSSMIVGLLLLLWDAGMKWVLPEYIEDILPAEAKRIEALRRKILDLFFSKDYELVMPPLLEYVDSLLTGTGHDLELRTFKVVDQLRAHDGGARRHHAAGGAHRRASSQPQGRHAPLLLRQRAAHAPAAPGATREPIQIGAEMYGEAGVAADVEMLELLCQALELAGVRKARVDIGHVAVFRAIAHEAASTPSARPSSSRPCSARTCPR